ncbi:class A beta-lactamase, subclass A2 [Mucilaginibacter flavus]|uniref:class A beta-lactamase, subclass A2 n=1 Tax=Mucilaginibacter flavus TaxID=931504 RepID=UPI0025B4BF92|nr:class A beta-lactamase, subclass A2 [Mucilaginibacter flavus]MDN3580662.1 class A beta-lactamase, subclass A2 [Mucilaginibacter flavus]
MRKFCLIFALFFCLGYTSHAQTNDLRVKIAEIAKESKGIVGVSILNLDTRDTLTYNGHLHLPMQSVMKYPIAITVLHEVDKGRFKLDQLIHVDKSDYWDTYSPLKDEHPNANFEVSIKKLLSYMVSQSDNVACDVLVKTLGGMDKVDTYIHSIGVQNVTFKATEFQMAQAWDVQYTNWAEVAGLTNLLDITFKANFLSPASHAYLWQIMKETSTGPKQIKGLLPAGTVVYHKTGRSGTNEQGITAATNDIGIITLPNGKHLAIAVFVSDTPVDMPARESIIARIARTAYDEAVK